ncbi:MAG: hypothetical protein ACREJB_19075 [Planctomycetaceae bacterium]
MSASSTTATPSSVSTAHSRWFSLTAWAALAGLLIANLPLMACMPLTADPVLYDLQARTALEGGVLYRDIVEPNLPGIVWVHMAVRTLFGWSSVALRLFDIVVVTGIVALLAGWVHRQPSRGVPPRPGPARPGSALKTATVPIVALLLFWFYFSLSEWTHCQRDVWLMLPALCAAWLRWRQTLRLSLEPRANRQAAFAWGVLEGVLWAAAFWIKPFVALPALAAIIVSALLTRRWRLVAADGLGVLGGGLIVGGLGSAWLLETGAWPHFWEMALEWNPAYFAAGRERWSLERYLSLQERFYPWSLVHLIAVPLALLNLLRVRPGFSEDRVSGHDDARNPVSQKIPGFCETARAALLSALYLGWVFEAHCLQHLFDYAHVPGTMLGVALAALHWPRRPETRRFAGLCLAAGVVVAALTSPATQPRRLAWWPVCLTEGSTYEVRAALQIVPVPNWNDLEPVIAFLEKQDPADGELTAYNVFLIHLYPELELRPSTRYAFLNILIIVFKDRSETIQAALEQSRQRFVVSSLIEDGMSARDLDAVDPADPPRLPPAFPRERLSQFPYNQRLVFRSGQYVVHEIVNPVGPLCTDSFPLDGDAR